MTTSQKTLMFVNIRKYNLQRNKWTKTLEFSVESQTCNSAVLFEVTIIYENYFFSFKLNSFLRVRFLCNSIDLLILKFSKISNFFVILFQ